MKKQGELLILKGLEGNEKAELTQSQKFLHPYTDTIVLAWTILFICTVVFLLLKYIVMPLSKKS